LIPFQVVYKGKTNRSLPRSPKAKRVMDHNSLTLILSNNHRLNLHTCQQFGKMNLVCYFQWECEWLDLLNDQKMVSFIDCWNVHWSSEFWGWMKEKYPNICLLFAPANCTSKLQPCYVIL
jgi:hypothetical protein